MNIKLNVYIKIEWEKLIKTRRLWKMKYKMKKFVSYESDILLCVLKY